MIREVTSLADVNLKQIERLGKLFVEESDSGEFDVIHFNRMFSNPLEMGLAKMWVIDRENQVVGVIGGVLSPLFFSKSLIAIEAFWFVDKENRGTLDSIRLLDHFVGWAESQHPYAVHLGYMENIHPEKVRDFYERRGYVKYETVYRKKL